jgi:hypothetical protein
MFNVRGLALIKVLRFGVTQSSIEVGDDVTYPNISLESSSKAWRSANLTPEAVNGLTDWRAIQGDHLNVIGVEDPSKDIKSMVRNV